MVFVFFSPLGRDEMNEKKQPRAVIASLNGSWEKRDLKLIYSDFVWNDHFALFSRALEHTHTNQQSTNLSAAIWDTHE